MVLYSFSLKLPLLLFKKAYAHIKASTHCRDNGGKEKAGDGDHDTISNKVNPFSGALCLRCMNFELALVKVIAMEGL